MRGNDREFWFKAESESQAAKWVVAIRQHIESSKGHKEQAYAPKTEQFWRQVQISEEQFI